MAVTTGCVAFPQVDDSARREHPMVHSPAREGSQGDRLHHRDHEGADRSESAAWLGVQVTPVPALVTAQLGLTPGMGLAVERVVPGSPAGRAGLRRHDILTKLDDQLLVNAGQLQVLVRSKPLGTVVQVTGLRKDGDPNQERGLTFARVSERIKGLFGSQKNPVPVDGRGRVDAFAEVVGRDDFPLDLIPHNGHDALFAGEVDVSPGGHRRGIVVAES